MIRAARLVLAVLACATLGACAHYRLGTDTAPRFATLHIAVVQSDIILPQARALISTQLRQAFLQDGRVRLVDSADDADATLTLTLGDYSRAIAVVRPDDTGLARRFDLTLEARAELRERRAGEPIFRDRPFSARRGLFTDSGQIQAETEALPLLAADLAESVRRAVLDPW